MTEPLDAWDDEPQIPVADAVDEEASPEELNGGSEDPEISGEARWVDDGGATAAAPQEQEAVAPAEPKPLDFLLSVTESVALIAEHAEKITAAQWRTLVMEGAAPAPAQEKPLRWSQRTVLAWIPNALESGHLVARVNSPVPAETEQDATGFMLSTADVLGMIAEHAEKITAAQWRALVMEGMAPPPVDGWDSPKWGYDSMEHWIQDALSLGVLHAPVPALVEEAAPEEPPAEPELKYGSTREWVEEFLIPVYRRQLSSNGDRTTWCPEWWKHAEAIIRLEALWRSWEYLRLDAHTGMSVWLKDHLDHHLPVLTGATDGPFNGCTPAAHNDDALQEFKIISPPPVLFPDVRESKEPKKDKDEGGRKA